MTRAQYKTVRHAADHGGVALHCQRCLWVGVVKTFAFGPQVSAESDAGMPMGKLRCPQCGADSEPLETTSGR